VSPLSIRPGMPQDIEKLAATGVSEAKRGVNLL